MNRRRMFRIAILAPLGLVLTVLLWAVVDSSGGASARTLANHRWESGDGAEVGGYLINPLDARRLIDASWIEESLVARPSADGLLPAILLIHEWWGLNAGHVRMAELLAAHGYVVLAPDALRGRLSVSVPGALFQLVVTPQPRIDADLDAALDELLAIEAVDPDRVAVAGFCFGGTQTMRIGTRRIEPAALAIFYGNGPITDPSDLGLLADGRPVLGIWGADDRTIPAADVERFEEALRAAGGSPDFTTFDGVGHAFVSPATIADGGAARDAWRTFLTFVADRLAP